MNKMILYSKFIEATQSNMNLPTQTLYEIRSLKLILAGEGNYKTMEEREEVIKRLRYSISETVLTMLLWEKKEQ